MNLWETRKQHPRLRPMLSSSLVRVVVDQAVEDRIALASDLTNGRRRNGSSWYRKKKTQDAKTLVFEVWFHVKFMCFIQQFRKVSHFCFFPALSQISPNEGSPNPNRYPNGLQRCPCNTKRSARSHPPGHQTWPSALKRPWWRLGSLTVKKKSNVDEQTWGKITLW